MRNALIATVASLSVLASSAASALGVRRTNANSDRWGTNFSKHFDDDVKAQKKSPAHPRQRNNPKRNGKRTSDE